MISVVIPVYRAEDCLLELYERLKKAIETVTEDFELVLVEDFGPDRSWDRIQELSRSDRRVKGLKLSRNFGQHQAITAGLDICEGDWVVVMDCDLQDPPEAIPALYELAKQGRYEIVIARREDRTDGLLRRAASVFYYKVFSWVSGIAYDPQVGNFRIMSRLVVDNFRRMRERLRLFGVLVDSMGFPVGHLDVRHGGRFAGTSSYRLRSLLKLALGGLIAYSNKPLVVSIALGFSIALLALLAGLYLIWLTLRHEVSITGWASTIVSIYFLSGVLLINLGIIGLYLSRVFDQVKGRPLYIVHQTVNLEKRD